MFGYRYLSNIHRQIVFAGFRQAAIRCCVLIPLLVLSSGSVDLQASQPEEMQSKRRFFETRIRPVLIRHCYECHAADSSELGGRLLLDHAVGLIQGGESGRAVLPGDPAGSLLIRALRYEGLEMPPSEPLSPAVIADFEKWIADGAFDPRTDPPVATSEIPETPPQHWAWSPPQLPAIPDVIGQQWADTEIDQLVLREFEAAEQRTPNDASSRIVARRLYLNLTGLPPTIQQLEEAEELLGEKSESGLESLVDRLLSSPQFGERWGRHWLDVARYGESNGNDGLGRNPTFPHAWRYRDYVIESINSDMPWDQFLSEQLAGDLLPADNDRQRDRQLIATGFLALGAKPAKAMNDDFTMDVVADQIDTIGRGILGVSIACARCHDHKTDPIPTSEYYALAGIFTSTETMWGLAANEGLTAPKTDLHVLKTPPAVLPPEGFVETVLVLESNTGRPKPIPKPPWPAGTPLAMGVRDRGKPEDCPINVKGSSKNQGDIVARGFPGFCSPELMEVPEIDPARSGRLELARWITHPQHPLTARVLANRVWMHLFGRGIVATPDEFGLYGEAPVSQDLLDYLAVRLVEDRWSLKSLIRRIVLSRVFRLEAVNPDDRAQIAMATILPQRRRLDAESFRDSVMSVAGVLDLEPPDGSLIRHRDILVNLAGNLHTSSPHRSVYLCYLRSSPPPELMPFDLPDFTNAVGQRAETTIPAQALFLLNSPFMQRQSAALAELICRAEDEPRRRIEFLWKQVLQRPPETEELNEAMEFVRPQSVESDSTDVLWQALCQSLLMTSEFRYLD